MAAYGVPYKIHPTVLHGPISSYKINKVIKIFYNSEMPLIAIQNMQNVKI